MKAEELRYLSLDELIAIILRQQALLEATQALAVPPPPTTSRRYLPWVTLAAVIVLLEVLILVFNVPRYLLPRPSEIIIALVNNLSYLSSHLAITVGEILIGFVSGAVIGIALAALLTHKPQLQDVVSPYVLFLLTMPMVSLVPLLSLRFGYGPETKMIVVALATFPVVMINAVTGLMRVEGARLDLMRSLLASEFSIFVHVRLPNALPHIFTGLMLGAVFAVITAVASEFVGGSKGLGNRLAYHAGLLQTDIVFAIILMLAVLSFALYKIVQWAGRRVVQWQE
jgi:NitT/TauT family transport system permease protein